jgi:hypothetical protein
MESSIVIIIFILVLIPLFTAVGIYLYKHEKKLKDLTTTVAAATPSNSVDGSTLLNNSVSSSKIVADYFLNPAYRYFIDSFYRLPALDTALTVSTNSTAIAYITSGFNTDFALLPTSTGSATLVSKGVALSTTTTSGDIAGVLSRVIIADTSSTFKYQTSFSLPTLTNVVLKIGLVLSDRTVSGSDDASQAFLLYDPTNAYSYALSQSAADIGSKFMFVYSVSGTDYITLLPITISASQIYNLIIKCSGTQQLSLFINNIQYSLNITTSGVYSGATAQIGSAGTGASAAYTNIRFFSTCKVTTFEAASKIVNLNYVKCAQLINY